MMLKESAGLNLQNTIGILVTFKAPPSLPITTLTIILHLPRGLSGTRLRVPEELTSPKSPFSYCTMTLSCPTRKLTILPKNWCYLERQYLSTVNECSFTRRNSPNFIRTLVILQKLAPLD